MNEKALEILDAIEELNTKTPVLRITKIKKTREEILTLTTEISDKHIEAASRHMKAYAPDWHYGIMDALNVIEYGVAGQQGYYDGF